MFSQMPKFPVDALLGIEEESEALNTVHDWVKNHQDHLVSVNAGARDRITETERVSILN